MLKFQVVYPGREWENGLRRICANAPSTLTRTLYGILLLQSWLLDFTRQKLHFVSSFSPVYAFPTRNTLHIFVFGVYKLNPIRNSEIENHLWNLVILLNKCVTPCNWVRSSISYPAVCPISYNFQSWHLCRSRLIAYCCTLHALLRFKHLSLSSKQIV